MQIQSLLAEATEEVGLFRAIQPPPGDFPRVDEVLTIPVRKDRRPLDGSPIGSALFDYAMEQKFGIERVRMQSVFTSNDYGVAAQYGDCVLKLMLPPNAPILYHPQVSDSGLQISLYSGPSLEFGKVILELVELKAEVEDTPTWKIQTSFEKLGTKNWYLDPAPILEKIANLARTFLDWNPPNKEDLVQRVVQGFKDAAPHVSEGYVNSTVGQLNVSGYVEVMVYGIDEYSGRVVRSR